MVGAIIGAAVAVVGAVVGMFFYRPPKTKISSNSNRASSSGLSINTCEEGVPITFVLGKGRVGPNLLAYSGLRAEAQYTTVTTTNKKGKKKNQQVKEGDVYFLNLTYGVARANVTLLTAYIDDKKQDDLNFNGNSYGFYVRDVKQILAFSQYELGFENLRPPSFHLVVESEYPTIGGKTTKMAGGMNPVGVIWATVQEAGCDATNFDVDSLTAHYQHFLDKGLGLNFVWDSQATLRQRLESILLHSGGYITEAIDDNGMRLKYLLRQDTDTVVATLDADDFAKFNMERVTQNKVPNYCCADYISAKQDYTGRAMRRYNLAGVLTAGRVDRSIDLTGFTDSALVDVRLQEIMQELSFPNAVLSFEVGLKYCWLEVGDLVTINHPEFGIKNLKVRITNKELVAPDKGSYPMQAEIDPAFLQDATMDTPETPVIWTPPDYTPVNLTKVRLWEAPRTPYNENTPALMILAARENDLTTSCVVMMSADASGYSEIGELTTFCQFGTLAAAYSASTYDIDDAEGLEYTPYREDPEFNTLSRAGLFGFNRFALVDSEMMAFETVTLLPNGNIRLGGIVRGLFNTGKAAHAANAQIWLIPNSDGLAFTDLPASGNIKLLTRTLQGTLDEAAATARAFTMTNKAAVPYDIGRIEAVRTGSSVVITWWPCNITPYGAGVMPESYTDQFPFLFADDFLYHINSGTPLAISDTTLTVTQSGAFTFNVRARQDGFVGVTKTLSVGAADGTYII